MINVIFNSFASFETFKKTFKSLCEVSVQKNVWRCLIGIVETDKELYETFSGLLLLKLGGKQIGGTICWPFLAANEA